MKWTAEKLQEECIKYKTIGEFQLKNGSAYNASKRLNIIDDIFKYHKNNGYSLKQKKSGYWTKYILQIKANKYDTRQEFREYEFNAYSAAKRKKFLNELFENHKNQGYSENEEWRENNYVIYLYKIEEKHIVYIGLTKNMIRRDREHLFNDTDNLYLYCKSNNICCPNYVILEEKLTAIEAKNKEKYWVENYNNNGWKLINNAKPGSLGKIKVIWTIKKLQEESNKFDTRQEFSKNSSSAYSIACSKKIISKLFKNHKNNGFSDKEPHNKYWTEEKLQQEVNKYENRNDFYKNSHGAYVYATNKRLMNKIFENHKNQGYKIKKPE